MVLRWDGQCRHSLEIDLDGRRPAVLVLDLFLVFLQPRKVMGVGDTESIYMSEEFCVR